MTDIRKMIYPLLILIYCHFSCTGDETKISNIPASEYSEYWEIGRQVSDVLLKSLQAELTATIKEKGIRSAIEVCSNLAPAITDSIKSQYANIEDIRRISYKYRNPVNAPDKLDQKILSDYTRLQISGGNPAQESLNKITDKSGEYFRYYKPLIIKPLCLNCHGAENQIDSEVNYLLKKLYPIDQAKGYANGQFRGLVRVTIRE